MFINRDLYPETPQFRKELITVLSEICRYLLEKRRQANLQENNPELGLLFQETNSELEVEPSASSSQDIDIL